MKILLPFFACFAISVSSYAQTVTDYDGNQYPIVSIGTQVWMGENLRSLHYADGTPIPNSCWYDNNLSTDTHYGKLYLWDAAMKNSTLPQTQGVCPNNWHVPSDEEWIQLFDFLGGTATCASALKGTDTTYWAQPLASSNTVGFNMVGAGNGYECTFFDLKRTHAEFWTSSEINNDEAKNWSTSNQSGSMFRHYNQDKANGFSVRCVNNYRAGIEEQKTLRSIQVSPNPVVEQATLSTDYFFKNATLDVYNSYGQKVMQVNNLSGQSVTFNRENLSSGVYYIRLSQEQKVIAADKLVVF